MKTFTLNIVLIISALIFIRPNDISAQNNKKKEVLWTADNLKWEQIPGGSGAMEASLWGDPMKGAHGVLTKFPAGFKAPLHYHTNDMKIVIIQGAYVYNGKSYGPGSYLFIPGGQKHESGGDANSETIFFTEQPGKFDLKPVASSK